MLAIIGWIVFGLIVGLIAKAIMPGRDGGGLFITTLLGIVGAVIGGFIGNMLLGYGVYSDGTVAAPGLIVSMILAVIGSIIVLAIYRVLVGRSLKY